MRNGERGSNYEFRVLNFELMISGNLKLPTHNFLLFIAAAFRARHL
jgi:hypothetical protein